MFKLKARGLPDDKKCGLTTKDAPALRKYLQGKQGALGSIVTAVPITVSADGTVTDTAILITQCQLISFDCMQREAHARFATPIAEGDPLPPKPWIMRALDPETNLDDRKTFHRQVHSNAVHELLNNSLTSSGYSKADLHHRIVPCLC